MIKRIFDITLSLILLPLILPIIILIAFLIKLVEGGKVFYIQERLGLNGKPFKLIKFRTMYENSNEILRIYLENEKLAQNEWKKYRKLKTYDPRITPFGKFLRRTSLDELPQIFNVLKGDMSIVGPRPYLKEEFEEYNIPEEIKQKILSVKPGITGLWQVECRNESTFEERIIKDLEYIEKQSLLLDLKLLLKTIYIVITGKGAY
jgi:exopolysaccharide production protein ExoY